MSMNMTRAECQEFLAGPHVGVMAIERADGPPLAVPVWYQYEIGGDVVVIIGAESVKQKLLERSPRFSLCAQQEDMPYRYVSVEGPVVSSEPVDREEHLRPMAVRYLGESMGSGYADASDPDTSLRVAMRPERWFSVDYGKS